MINDIIVRPQTYRKTL